MQDLPSKGSNNDFKHASLELDPEKEFENAKWIVLTSPQPAVDEKESAVDEGADKKDPKSSNKDQWSSGQ